ncbi:hypothetical protein B0J14DRAFT_241661 [Halenospora varia]|nr:hypothetical protein B0J14DRAFT_241661 [Halenospora varia]
MKMSVSGICDVESSKSEIRLLHLFSLVCAFCVAFHDLDNNVIFFPSQGSSFEYPPYVFGATQGFRSSFSTKSLMLFLKIDRAAEISYVITLFSRHPPQPLTPSQEEIQARSWMKSMCGMMSLTILLIMLSKASRVERTVVPISLAGHVSIFLMAAK